MKMLHLDELWSIVIIIWMEVLHLDEHLFRSFIHMDENVALG
jgi:hypothetical protein